MNAAEACWLVDDRAAAIEIIPQLTVELLVAKVRAARRLARVVFIRGGGSRLSFERRASSRTARPGANRGHIPLLLDGPRTEDKLRQALMRFGRHGR
jgi:hypothetical protein